MSQTSFEKGLPWGLTFVLMILLVFICVGGHNDDTWIATNADYDSNTTYAYDPAENPDRAFLELVLRMREDGQSIDATTWADIAPAMKALGPDDGLQMVERALEYYACAAEELDAAEAEAMEQGIPLEIDGFIVEMDLVVEFIQAYFEQWPEENNSETLASLTRVKGEEAWRQEILAYALLP